MTTERMMKHLGGKFWYANRKTFLYPGLYFCTGKANRRILPLPKPFEPPALVEFPEQTVVIAKDQPEYRPLPAYQHRDEYGTITCCWQLNFRDRCKVFFTGKVWHNILTFNKPLQPQLMLIDKPDMAKN